MEAVRTFSTDMPQAYRALLDTIAGSEAPSYDYIYGGSRLSSYADHPRQYIPIRSGPNVGKTSSAAGRYQFLGSSWDEAQRANNLPDFSPANQDKAAVWHAERLYRAKTGRDLLPDIEAAGNDPARLTGVLRPLSGWWTSLPGGIEHNSMTDSAGARFAQNVGFYANGGVAPPLPPSGGAQPTSVASPGATQPASVPPSGGAEPSVGALMASMLPEQPAKRAPQRSRRLIVNAGEGTDALFG